MQYFERAVFEMHTENQAPFNVLLSLLGTFYYNDKYSGNAPNQHASTDNPRKFTETGKTIGGAFRRYWETRGAYHLIFSNAALNPIGKWANGLRRPKDAFEGRFERHVGQRHRYSPLN